MTPLSKPPSGRTVRREILSLVTERGEIELDAARRELGVGSPAFEAAVMELVDENRLAATEDGRLRPGSATAPVQRHTVGGTTYRIAPVGPEETDTLLAAIRETDGNVPRVGGEALVGILRNERDLDDGATATDAAIDVGEASAEAPDQQSFLAAIEATGEPAGWAHVRDRVEAGPCRTAWVAANVRRPHRRGGLGRRLLVRCVGWAAVNGMDRLYTTVDPIDEETVAFLEAHGWQMKTLCVEDSEVVSAKLEVEV